MDSLGRDSLGMDFILMEIIGMDYWHVLFHGLFAWTLNHRPTLPSGLLHRDVNGKLKEKYEVVFLFTFCENRIILFLIISIISHSYRCKGKVD
jgi:hypothetical protein